jgi:hypothetical protein
MNLGPYTTDLWLNSTSDFADARRYIIDDTAGDSASLSWESGSRDVFQRLYNLTLDTSSGPW